MMRSARNRLFEEKSELIDQAMKRHGRVIQIYRLCREDVRQELALRMLECLDRYDFRRCPNLDAYLVEQLRYALLNQVAPSKRFGIPNAPRDYGFQVVSLEENRNVAAHMDLLEDLFTVREAVMAMPRLQRSAIWRQLYSGGARSSNKALRHARRNLCKKSRRNSRNFRR